MKEDKLNVLINRLKYKEILISSKSILNSNLKINNFYDHSLIKLIEDSNKIDIENKIDLFGEYNEFNTIMKF